MTHIEDHRHNELGTAFLKFYNKPDHKVYMSYESHSTKAFYYTLNDITELENSKINRIGIGHQTHSSISFWFLALESYINSILKLSCIKKNLDFLIYKNQDLGKRLSSLLTLLEIDRKHFNEFNIIGKINEFCRFRNELFHDRHFGEKIKFEVTNFSQIPFLSNQVDTFQAILIFIEIGQLLRYAIAGLDTMPSIIIRNNDVVLWEKLNICYTGILKEAFEASLSKHGLLTNLSLHLPDVTNFKSGLFKKGEIICLLTAEQDQKYFLILTILIQDFALKFIPNF